MTYSSNKASVDQLISELSPKANGRKLTAHKADMTSDEDLTELYVDIKAEHGYGPVRLVKLSPLADA